MKRELTIEVAGMAVRAKQIGETARPRHPMSPRLCVAKDATDTFGEARPALFFLRQLLFPQRGERIEARLAILFGGAPRRTDPAFLFHSMERRVERSFLDAQHLGGHLLNLRRDRVAVHRAARRERLEHEQAESALEDIVLCFWHAMQFCEQT